MLAVYSDNLKAVALLLQKGVDVNHSDMKGYTPLILAARFNRVDIARELLAYGANIDHCDNSWFHDSALSWATSKNHQDIVTMINNVHEERKKLITECIEQYHQYEKGIVEHICRYILY